MVKKNDEHASFSPLQRLSLYRGIYSRVAEQLGIDRSFVSRVASGQRRSQRVEQALLKEIERIERTGRKNSHNR